MTLCGGGEYIESLLLGETFKVTVQAVVEEAVVVVIEDEFFLHLW